MQISVCLSSDQGRAVKELGQGTSLACGNVVAVDCEFQLVKFRGQEECENVLASVAIVSMKYQSGEYFEVNIFFTIFCYRLTSMV